MEDTFNLGKVKTFLETWSGENVDQAYSLLYDYSRLFRENDNTETFVKQYLGEELYERLEITITFLKEFEKFKRSLNQISLT